MEAITDMKQKILEDSLKNKKVCVIGCGGLGCNVSVHLAGGGTGKLILCDFDTVSESNLNRQFFYSHDDIGKSKVKQAVYFLSRYAPDLKIEAKERKIETADDLDFAKHCDLIISAVDNFRAREAITEFCRKENIPLVCGAIEGFYGIAYLYLPHKSPCPKCAATNENVSVEKSVSSTAGIMGAYQTHLAIQYLLTKDETLSGNLLIFDNCEFNVLKIKASKECKICNITSEVKT